MAASAVPPASQPELDNSSRKEEEGEVAVGVCSAPNSDLPASVTVN